MIEQREGDWRTVVLAIGATGGALLAFLAAALILAYAVLGAVQIQLADGKRSVLESAVLASALVVIGIAFLPGAYYSIQRLLGRRVRAASPHLLRVPEAIMLVLLWLIAGAGAGYLIDTQTAKWATPILYVLAIAVPVFFFARLATGGLHPGSRQRLWGALASGMGLGVVPAMIAEITLAVLGLIGIGVYVALHPEQLATLQNLADQLRNSTDLEQVLSTAAPWLTSPIVLIAALLIFSVISPLIEESTKSLTTWAVYDRLASPAQGFAIGAMSGAAFGLVESLLASATPDGSWTTTLLVRGASTMMHIMSASLTGWGIALLRTRKSVGALIGLYVAAMVLHGAWNASVVAITFGSVHSAVVSGGQDVIGIIFVALGITVLALLCVGIPIGMAARNWRFRKMTAPVTTAPAEIWDRPDTTGEDAGAVSPPTHPRSPESAAVADETHGESQPPSHPSPLP